MRKQFKKIAVGLSLAMAVSMVAPATQAAYAGTTAYNVTLGTKECKEMTEKTLKLGERLDLNFYGVEDWSRNKANYKCEWTASGDAVTVGGAGLVTAVKSGTAVVNLAVTDTATGVIHNVTPVTIMVLDEPVVYDVTLGTKDCKEMKEASLKIGEQLDLNFYGVEDWSRNKANYKCEWTASGDAVTVGGAGLVTAVKSGAAEISLTITNEATGASHNVTPTIVTVIAEPKETGVAKFEALPTWTDWEEQGVEGVSCYAELEGFKTEEVSVSYRMFTYEDCIKDDSGIYVEDEVLERIQSTGENLLYCVFSGKGFNVQSAHVIGNVSEKNAFYVSGGSEEASQGFLEEQANKFKEANDAVIAKHFNTNKFDIYYYDANDNEKEAVFQFAEVLVCNDWSSALFNGEAYGLPYDAADKEDWENPIYEREVPNDDYKVVTLEELRKINDYQADAVYSEVESFESNGREVKRYYYYQYEWMNCVLLVKYSDDIYLEFEIDGDPAQEVIDAFLDFEYVGEGTVEEL